MATVKHMSGPWKIEYDNEGNGSFHEWFNVGPARVSFATPDHAGRLKAEANARLIVAAPLLLEALETLFDLDCISYCDYETEKVEAGDQARAAIKAATES